MRAYHAAHAALMRNQKTPEIPSGQRFVIQNLLKLAEVGVPQILSSHVRKRAIKEAAEKQTEKNIKQAQETAKKGEIKGLSETKKPDPQDGIEFSVGDKET